MQMADSGASKPRYTSRYWLFFGESSFDRQIKLEVTRPGKFSMRKPDLWRSTTQERIYGIDVDLTFSSLLFGEKWLCQWCSVTIVN